MELLFRGCASSRVRIGGLAMHPQYGEGATRSAAVLLDCFFDDVMGEEAWNSWGESLQHCTRWWFQIFFIFTPNYLGK